MTETQNLGIIFDRSLSWDRHVSNVTQRCFGVLTGLSHLSGHLPTAVLSALINALAFSQLRYCISVYGSGKKGNLCRLQKAINPRPAGGGAFERPPPLRFFEDSEKTAARSAAGFSPTLPPIFSATFVKISTQCHMRSGHQVRSSDPTTK